jgi:hypothetical protein
MGPKGRERFRLKVASLAWLEAFMKYIFAVFLNEKTRGFLSKFWAPFPDIITSHLVRKIVLLIGTILQIGVRELEKE